MPTSTTTNPPPPKYKLSLEIGEPAQHGYFKGKSYYRMTAKVTDSEGMPKAVFVCQRKLPIGEDNREIDEFIGVAGPYDLVSLSETALDSKRLLRKDEISVILTSPELAEEFVSTIRTGCQNLVNALTRLDLVEISQQFEVSSPAIPQSTTTP